MWVSPSSTCCSSEDRMAGRSTTKMESPYCSSFGRWWASWASSTARSWSSNSCWICLSNSGEGSCRPTHTKTPGCLRASLMSGMATSPRRLPSAYATLATTPSIGALGRAAVADKDKRRPQGGVGHGGIAEELELGRAQRGRAAKRLIASVGLEETRGQEGRRLGGHRPVRDEQGARARVEEGPRQAREALPAQLAVRGRRVAGREHDPVRVELELGDLGRVEEPVLVGRGRGGRRQGQRGLALALELAGQDPVRGEGDHAEAGEIRAPHLGLGRLRAQDH